MAVLSQLPLPCRPGVAWCFALALLAVCTVIGPAQAAEPAHETSKEPSDATGYNARGYAKAAQGDLKGAVADYDRALELDSSLAAAFRNRASAKKNGGDFAGAIEDATQAIQLDPDDAAAANTRGEARLATDSLDGAISDFSRAISRDPKSAIYYLNRAMARDAKGSAAALAAAMSDFRRAFELDPRSPEPYLKHAEFNRRHHDWDGALADLDNAVALNAKDVRAYVERREVRLLRAEVKGALADATRVVELDPSNPVAYSNRGMNRMLVRQWPEALEDYRRSIELSRTPNDDAHLYVWLIRARLGETKAANEELAAYLATRPASTSPDWYASAAGFLLGKITGEKLIAASTAPERFEGQRRQCKAWYYIGMKKLFAKDKGAIESLARCIMDEQLATPECQLAVTELGVVARPPHESPADALARFIQGIPFKNAYSFQSDEHSVTLKSKKAWSNEPEFHEEAMLDFYGPMPWTSDQSLEDHLRAQMAFIRKRFPIAPYMENDHAPTDNVASFIETIEGVQVGFIKYWVNHPNTPTPPSSVQAVILKDKKQYTFTLATFVPETQESYRQDLRLLIETLLKNGRL